MSRSERTEGALRGPPPQPRSESLGPKALGDKRTMKTDAALWTTRRVFGAAGGPDEIALTAEGLGRAFSVGAQVRRGGPAEALEALWSAQGAGYLSTRNGVRLIRTELGRFDQIAWGHLRALGFVESFQDEQGDGVRLTKAGKDAAWAGISERSHLLDRCRNAATIDDSATSLPFCACGRRLHDCDGSRKACAKPA